MDEGETMSIPTELPLSTHFDLTDGEYGVIVKLHTGQFTQEDLAEFNSNPELIIEWSLGTITIPSGITFGSNDRLYFPVEIP